MGERVWVAVDPEHADRAATRAGKTLDETIAELLRQYADGARMVTPRPDHGTTGRPAPKH